MTLDYQGCRVDFFFFFELGKKEKGTVGIQVSAPSGIQGQLELFVIPTDRAMHPL